MYQRIGVVSAALDGGFFGLGSKTEPRCQFEMHQRSESCLDIARGMGRDACTASSIA